MSSLPLLALVFLAPQTGEATVTATAHFAVVCDWDSERAAKDAAQVVEAVYQVAGQIYDLSRLDLEHPLQVNLYSTLQAYEEVDERLTGGRFARNQAFADPGSRSAHVALQPVISNAVLDRGGLPIQTRRLIAHEAAHLLRIVSYRNNRSHPRWYVDGSASWIDQAVMETLGLSAGLEGDPFTASAIVRLQALIENQDLPSIDKLLVSEFRDLTFLERYDISELFFRFLIEGPHKKRLAKLVEGPLRRLGGGTDFASRLRKEFKKIFGRVSFRRLDKEFRKYIGTLQPEWSQAIRSLENHEDSWRQMAFTDLNAVAWRTESIESKNYELTGEFEILEGGRHQLNVLLDRDDKGFVSIAFSPGALTIFHYHSRSEEWERLLGRKVDGLGINMPYEFRIAVNGKRLQVFLRGEELAGLTIKNRNMHGPWGLGVQAGGVGIWHGLKGPGID